MSLAFKNPYKVTFNGLVFKNPYKVIFNGADDAKCREIIWKILKKIRRKKTN